MPTPNFCHFQLLTEHFRATLLLQNTILNSMLKVEPTGQRGRTAMRSGNEAVSGATERSIR